MTSGPDSLYIEHCTVHLARLMAHTSRATAATSTSPESQATRWHFVSVTIYKPLFPHLKATKRPSHWHWHTLSAIGAPSHIIGPFMFRPQGGAEA